MNAHQLVINELLNETSSSSEDESYLNVLFITNTDYRVWQEKDCKNCQFRINCGSFLGQPAV
jgi:hypothetical protein